MIGQTKTNLTDDDDDDVSEREERERESESESDDKKRDDIAMAIHSSHDFYSFMKNDL